MLHQKTLPDLVIRHIESEHSEQLRALYALSLDLNRAGFIQPGTARFKGDIYTLAQEYSAANGAMLGLFSEQKLIGMGGLKPAAARPETVELCHLHLDPEFKGLGLGKKLAIHLIELASTRNYKNVELHVTATQEAAIGLYRKLNFRETDRRIYTHDDGTSYDTIYMALDIG